MTNHNSRLREFVLTAAPMAPIVVGTLVIVTNLAQVGILVIGQTPLFGGQRVTVLDLPGFKSIASAAPAVALFGPASLSVRVFSLIPLLVDAALVAIVAVLLQRVLLRVSDADEVGSVISSGVKHLGLVIVAAGMLHSAITVGASIAVYTALGLQDQLAPAIWLYDLADCRVLLFSVVAGLVAATWAYRLREGITPDPQEPIDITEARAARPLESRSSNERKVG